MARRRWTGGCSSKDTLKPQCFANVRKTENTGSSSTPTFEQFQAAKRKEWATSFRPAKRKNSIDTGGDVPINCGIVFDGNQLKLNQRSASLSVTVPKVSTKDQLLAAGLAKHKAHSINLIKDWKISMSKYLCGNLCLVKLQIPMRQ